MSLVVLRQAVDTLEASVDGSVDESILECLEVAKVRAQERDTPSPLTLGEFEFAVSAQGAKPYRYKLSGPECSLRLTDVEHVPAVSLRLSALGLAEYDVGVLYDHVLGIVESSLGCLGRERLSRIDLCADFQGHDLTDLSGARFVCPAEFRPIYPNVDRPGTYHFGKGDMVVRVYNKTKELGKSEKLWMNDLWRQHPDYDPTLDVWRFEVQYRRGRLRELGLDTPADAFDSLPELLRHGLAWCDLRVPEGEKSDRWPRHPTWDCLAEATGTHTILERQELKKALTDLSRLVPVVAGYAVSAGAVLEDYDLESVLGILLDRVHGHFDSPQDFERAARTRRLERLG